MPDRKKPPLKGFSRPESHWPRDRSRIEAAELRAKGLAEQIAAIPEAEKRKVELMASYGAPRLEIARAMALTLYRLEQLYSAELERGASTLAVNLSRRVAMGALGAPAEFDKDGNMVRAEVKADWRLLMFAAERRAGWKRPPVEVTGKDGAPIKHAYEPVDFEEFTDEELAVFAVLHEKALAARTNRLTDQRPLDSRDRESPGGDPRPSDTTRH
jgi:hypothetical protein